MPRRSLPSRSPFPSALWIAAGAAAGVLVGVAVADRYASGHLVAGWARRWFDQATGGGAAGGDGYEEGEEFEDEDEDEEEAEEGGGDDEDEGEGLDARVLAAFEQDPVLAHRAIEIDELPDGTIALTGSVATVADANHAGIIAHGVPGVRHVDNQIRVRQRQSPQGAPTA